jgi:hypothetical protein
MEGGGEMKHLDGVEQHLEEAAREVRAVAKHSVPPTPETPARRTVAPGWLIFAAAFGAVILAVGVIPLISSPDNTNPAEGSTPTTEPAPVSTVPAPTTTVPAPTTVAPTTVPTSEDCSAAGMAMPADQEGLPPAVAATRRAILEAAIACDFDALEAVAGPDFITSFGGTGFEKIPEWEETGQYPATKLMVQLFETPYAFEDYEGEPRHYYWPSAFVYDSWDEIPPEDMEALRSIYTEEELEMSAEFGSYALWRIGITETGEWRSFIAGD